MARLAIKEVSVLYNEQTLDIKGFYVRSQPSYNRDTPSEGENFEIEIISYKGTDITELFYELVDDDADLIKKILSEIEGQNYGFSEVMNDIDED